LIRLILFHAIQFPPKSSFVLCLSLDHQTEKQVSARRAIGSQFRARGSMEVSNSQNRISQISIAGCIFTAWSVTAVLPNLLKALSGNVRKIQCYCEVRTTYR
jgi:hypothetical protein